LAAPTEAMPARTGTPAEPARPPGGIASDAAAAWPVASRLGENQPVEGTGDLLRLQVHELLDVLASDEPAPAGGSAAALAVAMSAGLSAMVARASTAWPEARAAVAQAERLRKRTAPLAQRDADAYEEALAAMRLPERVESSVRDATVGGALARAAEVPLAIAEAGADAALLAALVADRGLADRRGDAVAAALLAEAGARAAASLVVVNLTVSAGDERVARAQALAETAAQAAREAVRSLQSS
jgi:formiminotetrahydrofolate cyclodeaminase